MRQANLLEGLEKYTLLYEITSNVNYNKSRLPVEKENNQDENSIEADKLFIKSILE